MITDGTKRPCELRAPAAAGGAAHLGGLVGALVVVLESLGDSVALGGRRFENIAVGDADEAVAQSSRRGVAAAGLELGLEQAAGAVVPDHLGAAGVEHPCLDLAARGGAGQMALQ